MGPQAAASISVEGATEDQLTTLYSNLYRLNLYPNSAFENTGTDARSVRTRCSRTAASDPSASRAPVRADGKVYVNNGFWDTYRTAWSGYSLFDARRTPASSSTASSSSTATAAGSPAGRRPATRT